MTFVARSHRLVLVLALALSTGIIAGFASAQEDPADSVESKHKGLEEIVVTAEKREQSLQEVPAAISAFSGDQLFDAGIEDVDDLSFNVPNFHYGESLGAARITIRGVSSTGEGSDQATAFHVDGIYQNSELIPAALTFYDLERVEVLRGPQGTLYGRNATGGSINVITNKPGPGFDAFGDFQVGNYRLTQTRMVLNVPLIDDTLFSRFGVFQLKHDGYQLNELSGHREDSTDDADTWGARGQFLLTPNDDVELILRGTYTKVGGTGFALKNDGPYPGPKLQASIPIGAVLLNVSSDPFLGALPNSSDPRRARLDYVGEVDADNASGNGEASWYLPSLGFLGDTRIKLIGSIQDGTTFASGDFDLSSAPAVARISDIENREYVAELHWASANAGESGLRGDLQWQIGAFFLQAGNENSTRVPTTIPLIVSTLPPLLAFPQLVILPIPYSTTRNRLDRSAAAYTQLDFDVIEDLTLTGGVRYSHDWKEMQQIDGSIIPTLTLPPFPPTAVCVQGAHNAFKEDDWGSFSGTLRAQYRFDDEHNVYASFSPGYKAGTLNANTPSGGLASLTCAPFTINNNASPEHILAYEVGSKNRFLDNRLHANFTFFYYDYDDLQVSTLVDTAAIIDNADNARLFGLELELLTLLIDDKLTLMANFAYMNSEYQSYFGRMVENPTRLQDFSGNQMTRAPRFSGTFVAQYDQELGRFGSISPRVQIFASDRVFFRASNDEFKHTMTPMQVDTQDPYWLLGLRATWRDASDRLFIEAFVDNVLDKDIRSYKSVGSSLLGAPISSGYEAPRTIGLRFGLSW